MKDSNNPVTKKLAKSVEAENAKLPPTVEGLRTMFRSYLFDLFKGEQEIRRLTGLEVTTKASKGGARNNKRGYDNISSNATESDSRRGQKEHANNEGKADKKPNHEKCTGCGRFSHKAADCLYKGEPGYNPDPDIPWIKTAFAKAQLNKGGPRWLTMSDAVKQKLEERRKSLAAKYDQRSKPSYNSSSGSGHNKKRYGRDDDRSDPPKRSKEGEPLGAIVVDQPDNILAVIKTSNSTTKTPTTTDFIPCTVLQRDDELAAMAFLDTGARQGNYISTRVAEWLSERGQVLSSCRGSSLICGVNDKLCTGCMGSVSIRCMLNPEDDPATPITLQFEADVINSIYDIIIGRPTIKDYNLVSKFPSHFLKDKDIGITSSAEPVLITSEKPDRLLYLNVRTKEELLDKVHGGEEWLKEPPSVDPILPGLASEGEDTDLIDKIRLYGSPEFQLRLRELCIEFRQVFSEKLDRVPAALPPMELQVDTDKWLVPKNRRSPRPQTSAKEDELRKQIDLLLKHDIIRPSKATHFSQVLLPPKPDGSYRFCIDYRSLNNASNPESWPLPNIAHVLQRVGQYKPKFFGKMDFTQGFWQIELSELSRKFTAFTTFMGVYEWNRVPMGLKGAPSYFQAQISHKVLAGLIYHICESYIDDVISFARTEDEFLARLRQLLERLLEFNIKLKPSKCAFGMNETEFLGHVISAEGITMSKAKIEKVLRHSKPTVIREMRSFLGLANYFRKHVQNHSSIVAPLFKMCGEDKDGQSGHTKTRRKASNKALKWTQESEAAYDTICSAIANCPTLYFLDDDTTSYPIYLHTDASDYGVGGYLFQMVNGVERPVAFCSASFAKEQTRWSTPEKEAYAIYYAFHAFEYLIRDRKFTLRTDHANLTYINDSGSPKVIRWKLAIQEFDFNIEHVKGEDNIAADYLSRVKPATTDPDVLCYLYDDYGHIPLSKVEMMEKAHHVDLPSAVELGQIATDKLTRIAATNQSSGSTGGSNTNVSVEQIGLEEESLMKQYYDDFRKVHGALPGHHGIEKTVKKLLKLNNGKSWPKMRSHVSRMIRECPFCQKMNFIQPVVQAKPYTTGAYEPWERINIDAIGPLPATGERGYRYIIVVIDCFTRFVELFPAVNVTAQEAKQVIMNCIGRYGVPGQLLTDSGSQFDNETITALINLLSIHHQLTLPYSKQENSIVERANKEVLRHLNAMIFETRIKDEWCDFLPLIQRIMNASPHGSIGVAPAQLLFGNAITLDRGIFMPMEKMDGIEPSNTSLMNWMAKMLSKQQELIQIAQKLQSDNDTRHLDQREQGPVTEFPINSLVLARYHNNARLPGRAPTKLHTPYKGPLRVVSRDGSKYTLQDLVTLKLEDYHVTSLKSFDHNPENTDPIDVANRDNQNFIVERVLQHKGNFNKKSSLEFLVKWEGYDDAQNTWQTWASLRTNVRLHEYLRSKGLAKHIPKNIVSNEA
jgi:hypothetical protein